MNPGFYDTVVGYALTWVCVFMFALGASILVYVGIKNRNGGL